MEKHWERTLPFFEIDYNDVCRLFKGVVKKDDIDSVTKVNEGCRTSNYIIECKNGDKYLLKISDIRNQKLKGEEKLIKLVNSLDIPAPKIYKTSDDSKIDNIQYTIYEYIEGDTISSYVSNGNKLNNDIIKSAAFMLGKLHNNKFNQIGLFDDNLNIEKKIEPIIKSYELCITDIVESRLGKERINNILNIVNNNKLEISNLDKYPGLIHGDFQGTNILICNNNICGIIDWEFSMSGHPIADIGVFFRYDEYFNQDLIDLFESEYNKVSEYKLNGEWYKISKIRDLINLIKLIDTEQNMPNKHKKIKQIIDKTINNYL